MKHHPAAWIFIVAAALFVALPSLSCAEERFGPWVYYAPYYYPPFMKFAGRPMCPQDFAPKYESPNPPQPSNAVPPRPMEPPKRVTKVSSRRMDSGMGGSHFRNYQRSSISTPYTPKPRQERVNSVPSATVRPSEPSQRSASFPPPQETQRPPYLPPAKPTPQLSSPGVGANHYPPSPQPAAQQTPARVPDASMQHVNQLPQRVETPEMPSATTSPAQRPSLSSAPVERHQQESVAAAQPQSGNAGAGKKSWSWGRQSPNGNRQTVPRMPGSGDQNL